MKLTRLFGLVCCALLLYVLTGYSQGPTVQGLELNWMAANGATGYHVYRGTTTGVFTPNACSGTNPPCTRVGTTSGATTFLDGSGNAGTRYFYVVTALYGATESGTSNEVNEAFPLVRPRPSGLTAVPR